MTMASHRSSLRAFLGILCAVIISLAAHAQGPTPGQNINMVSGITFPGGDPFLQRQNEPSLAVSTRNPLHLLMSDIYFSGNPQCRAERRHLLSKIRSQRG